jgi:hypothetical protein
MPQDRLGTAPGGQKTTLNGHLAQWQSCGGAQPVVARCGLEALLRFGVCVDTPEGSIGSGHGCGGSYGNGYCNGRSLAGCSRVKRG